MIRVLHLTDTHLAPDVEPRVPPASFADAVHALSGRTTDAATAQVLAHVAGSTSIDLLLHTGDVVDEPRPTSYPSAPELLGRVGAPMLLTGGNHDDPALLEATFGAAAPIGSGHVDLGGWRIVVAHSAWPGVEGGTFGPDVLADLDALLDVDRQVLVGTHHPPLSPCGDPDCTITDLDAFFAVIDRHPNVVAVATGHVHLAAEAQRSGVRYLMSPSTCMQLIHEHPLPANNHAPTPTGARYIDLHDDGTLSTELVWLPATSPGTP